VFLLDNEKKRRHSNRDEPKKFEGNLELDGASGVDVLELAQHVDPTVVLRQQGQAAQPDQKLSRFSLLSYKAETCFSKNYFTIDIDNQFLKEKKKNFKEKL
jgi:hypothetical protein